MPKIKISFVIPVYNEAENLIKLFKELMWVIKKNRISYEIIFINDGSTDNSLKILRILSKIRNIHVLNTRKNKGKANALNMGFQFARNDFLVTLDADLQDKPSEVMKIVNPLLDGYDFTTGWRKVRKDRFIKKYTSIFYNLITSIVTGVWVHDHNCGFKGYRLEAAKQLKLYGELHRYIPALIKAEGYRICEIEVEHQERYKGTSKYGINRFLNGFLDLLTVLFITKYNSSPIHFFGYLGFTFFTLGFIFATYLLIIKVFNSASIGDRPLLMLATLLMIIGVQITITGIIGEQLRHIQETNNKKI